MLSSIGRAAVRRVGAGVSQQSTNRVFLQSLWQLERADKSNNADSIFTQRPFYLSLRRSYATTVKATVPKSEVSIAAKPTAKPKKAAPKKSAKKAVKKKPKKKLATKSKVKAKPKKKVLTDEQKKRATLRALKLTALTPPTLKPRSTWLAFLKKFNEDNKSSAASGATKAKDASVHFKSITTEELESLNQTVNQNRRENEVEYKKWIESHTPDEIRLANNARRQLKKTVPKGSSKYTALRDSRLPKHPRTALLLFIQSRWNSGDFKGISIMDAGKRIRREWNELSPSERQPYEAQQAAQKRQYIQEYRTVFGRDSKAAVQ